MNNIKTFKLVVKYVGIGISFRQTSIALNETKEVTGAIYLGTINQDHVINLCRIACAISIQKISDMMKEAWCFSLALDTSSHQCTTYLDLRIRVHALGDIQNFHLLAIPMDGRKTATNIWNLTKKALHAVLPEWRIKLLAVTTDGENTMVSNLYLIFNVLYDMYVITSTKFFSKIIYFIRLDDTKGSKLWLKENTLA